MFALTFGILIEMSFLFTDNGLASVFPQRIAPAVVMPALTTYFGDGYATGPVAFWDGAVVMCQTSVTDPFTSARSDFTRDWRTFSPAFTGRIDRTFQKQLDIRIGVIDHRRVASALVHGDPDTFVDSYRPAAPDLSNPDVT